MDALSTHARASRACNTCQPGAVCWGGRDSLTAPRSAAGRRDHGNVIPRGHHLPVCCHTAGLTSWARSSLTLPAPGKVIRFTSKFVKYSRLSKPYITPGTSRTQPRCQLPTSTMQLQFSCCALEIIQGQGHRTHHSGLTGSPLHLLLQHHHPAPTFRMLNPTSLPCCIPFIHNAECYADLQPAPAKGQDMQMLLPASEDPTRLCWPCCTTETILGGVSSAGNTTLTKKRFPSANLSNIGHIYITAAGWTYIY